MQWDLQAHVGNLSELLADVLAEEGQVLQRLDDVLATEAQIKRAQVSMLVGLRKVLTREQLEEALRLRGGMAEFQQHLGKLEKETRRVRDEMVKVQKRLQSQAYEALRESREEALKQLEAMKEASEAREREARQEQQKAQERREER